MDIAAIANQVLSSGRYFGWPLYCVLILMAVLIVNAVVKRVLKWFDKYFKRTRRLWDDAVIRAVSGPLRGLIWVIGLSVAAGIIARQSQLAVPKHFVSIASGVALIIVVAWFLLRAVGEVEYNLTYAGTPGGRKVDLTTADALGKLGRVVVLIIALLIILQTVGYSISGVLAFGGVGGIALGFAAQGLLSNLFGGLTIYLDQPFKVGDWIASPDREIEGTVEHIGWRSTRIRRFDQRPIYAPNSIFNSAVLINPSRMTNRRIQETVSVRFADVDRVAAIVEDIEKTLKEDNRIDHDQSCMVWFDGFGTYSLNIMIYCFTRTRVWYDYLRVKNDVLLTIAGLLTSHGAQLSLPLSRVQVTDPLKIDGTTGQAPISAGQGNNG